MAKVLVVTSGKGGVGGKPRPTATLARRFAQSGEEYRGRGRFRRRLAQSRSSHGRRTTRGHIDLINVIQSYCKTSQHHARQASGYIVAVAGFADPRQGCTHRRRRCQGYRAAAPEVRLGGVVGQYGRHRARSDARYAACRRRRGHCDQPGGFLGTRIPTASSVCSTPRPRKPRRANGSRNTY